MKSRRTKNFHKLFSELNTATKRKAVKAYRLWKNNPYHESLHFKRLNLASVEVYSVRINDYWRAVAVKNEDAYLWFWIGSHSEYDVLIKKL